MFVIQFGLIFFVKVTGVKYRKDMQFTFNIISDSNQTKLFFKVI